MNGVFNVVEKLLPEKVKLFAPTPKLPGLPHVKELVFTPLKTVPGVGLLKVALALPEIFVACAEAANRDETTNAIAIFFI